MFGEVQDWELSWWSFLWHYSNGCLPFIVGKIVAIWYAVHDGHANTYSLTKDIVCHKLKSLIKEGEKVCSSARVCLVNQRKFLDGMKHQHMCYALIPRKDKEGNSEIPLQVSVLLSEYWDVISNNVLEGLPLVRKISHQIDLVPRASLPNKATHRMTPIEIEELNKKV